MNEAIIENYLSNIQCIEPEYMTEGIREFVGKFNKTVLKRTADRIHHAFSRGDSQALEDVTRQAAGMAKIPKYQEVKSFTQNYGEENTQFKASAELSKKVIRNTYKVRDKAKLEILGNAIAVIGMIKSKGGKYDSMKMTKDALKDVNIKLMNIYDAGFDNIETSSPDEEAAKQKMMEQAKKQEKLEMIIVGVVLSVMAAAIIWAGVTLFGIGTSPLAGIIAAIMAFLLLLFKVQAAVLGVGLPIALAAIGFMKA